MRVNRLWLDLETRSRTDVKLGPYVYSGDPDFRVLMVGWSTDGQAYHVATTPADIAAIPGLTDPRVLKIAHNAQFDRVCLSAHLWSLAALEPQTFLPPEQWHDTAMVAAEKGYPRGLDKLTVALNVERKDSAGKDLIKRFCVPDRKTKEFNSPQDHPEEWADFVRYCAQDVAALVAVDRALGDAPAAERLAWIADQRINDRGIRLDRELATVADEAVRETFAAMHRRMVEVTGLDNPNSITQLGGWLREGGLDLPDMRAATVDEALATGELSDAQREVLTARREMSLTSPKKFGVALSMVGPDDRLRGQFKFFGAHTGRWSGRGVQLQNLPREGLDDPEPVIAALKGGSGAELQMLKKLVRPMFLGPLTVADYASIEARVIAWLAGERWALDAFALGRDIYAETASRMGFPMDEASFKTSRQRGKVAVLALGYGGGINSLRVMGADGADDELQEWVYQWRDANPRIATLWKKLAWVFAHGGRAGRLDVAKDGTDRAITLPSGRAMVYRGVAVGSIEGPYGPRMDLSFRDPVTTLPVRTYGGRLAENVTQAIARDVLAEALVRLDAARLPVVGHVHDEVLVETDDVARVIRVMTTPAGWFATLPVAATGEVVARYAKG